MKKIISAVLSAFLLLSAVPFNCTAEDDDVIKLHKYKDFYYELHNFFDSEEQYVSIYMVPDGDRVEIPNEINGLPVKEISDNSFNKVNTLVIPDNVDTIPNSLNSWDDTTLKAFEVSKNNPNYSSINGLLYNKQGTMLYAIPNGIETDTLTLPEGLETIRSGATSTAKIKNLVLPASLKVISSTLDTLSIYTSTLESVSVSEKNINYVVQDGVLFSKNGLLVLYPPSKEGTSYSVPKGVKTIGTQAFTGSKLKTLYLPESVTEIYMNSLNISGLERIYLPKSIQNIDNYSQLPPDIYYGGSKEDYMNIKIIYGYYPYYKYIDNSNKTIHYNVKTFKNNGIGDPDGNDAVNASDASWVLSEYSNLSTSDRKGMEYMPIEDTTASDVNSDGSVNASDASLILTYYSMVSTGGTQSFKDFVKPYKKS